MLGSDETAERHLVPFPVALTVTKRTV